MRYLLLLFCCLYVFGNAAVDTEGVLLGNGYLPDEMSLSSVSFVGAHNSSVSKDKGWLYYQQAVGLEAQFNKYGVRAFKIPLHWFNPNLTVAARIKRLLGFEVTSQPYIALCHEPNGKDNCFLSRLQRKMMSNPEPALDYLVTLRQLLESHPDEVVILMIEDYLSSKSKENGMKNDDQSIEVHLSQLLEEAGLKPYVFHLGKKYRDRDWPTLGKLREKDRRLIIISDDNKDGMDPVSLYRETGFEYSLDDLLDGNDEPMRKGSRDTTGRSHFFLMNHFVQWSFSSDSIQGEVLSVMPQLLAHSIHENLDAVDYSDLNAYALVRKRVERLTDLQGRSPNIILIDFVNQGADGGVQRVVYEMNVMQLHTLE